MRLLIFGLLELLLGPLQSLAILAYTWKLWRHNIPAGVSGTAYEPFFGRVMMHGAGTRPDPAAARVAPHLPALSGWIVALIDTIGLASRWSGYRGALFSYPAARPSGLASLIAHRTDFFDRLVTEATAGERPASQLVILGAGWDTRAYGPLADTGVHLFEVDMPPTQQAKRAALARAGIETDHVTFVETDFNQRSWFAALTEAGFDPALRSFVLWEGVTMYLDDPSVEATLRDVARLPPGSAIAFDYLSRELVEARRPFWLLGKLVRLGLKFYAERFSFGIVTVSEARERVVGLLAPCGLALAEYEPLGAPPRLHGGLVLAVTDGQDPRPPTQG